MFVLGSSGGELLASCWVWSVFKHAKIGCPYLSSQWVTGFGLVSILLKMVVLASLASEWLSLPYFQIHQNWLSLPLQWVSELALFLSLLKILVFASPVGEWLSLFPSLLKMIIHDNLGGEWLGLFCLQACWKWLSLALQKVSDWICFVFKLAENGCLWLSRGWVTELLTGLTFFPSLLKIVVLGSPVCEWLSLLYFQAFWKCLSLALQWVSEWSLLCFQTCWNWLFLSLQEVSDWACFVFKPAENGCSWLSRMWVTWLALFSNL